MINKRVTQAVIFCGGFGTRVKKFTRGIPKPLYKINRKSFLEYLILNIKRFGINEILLLCHYKTDLFTKLIKKIKNDDLKIKVVHEKYPRGSGGALINAKKFLKKNFYILNGDTFFDFNYLDLQLSLNKKFLSTIAILYDKNIKKGQIKLNKKKNFLSFDKKINSKFLNTGVAILDKKIFQYFKYFKNKKFISLENDIYPILSKLKKINGKVYNSKNNFFIDIGTPKDIRKINSFFNNKLKKNSFFLDRDGIINKDTGYVHKTNQIIWGKNIFRAVKLLNDKNYYVFVVTNQSGIGRGYYSEGDVRHLHQWINRKMIGNLCHIDDFFFSPFYKFSSKANYRSKKFFLDRKPNIGMFLKAKKKWNINLKKTIMIGDQNTDKDFAKKSGINFFMAKYGQDLLQLFTKIVKRN
jgi:D,D-heptose 1,7-bisphosphate phosphatase